MPQLLRSSRGTLFRHAVCTLCISVLSFLCIACGDEAPTSEERVMSNLQDGRAKWANLNPHNYSFEFKWRCVCAGISQKWMAITVKNDSVTEVTDITTGFSLDEEGRKQYLTIDQMFDFIESAKEARDIIAVFSDLYGIPVNVAIDYDEGAGDEKGFESRKLIVN